MDGMTSPRRERADAARNRVKILTAAAEIVAAHGVEGLSMAEVAAAAGGGTRATLFASWGPGRNGGESNDVAADAGRIPVAPQVGASGFLPAGRHDVARRARDAGVGLMTLSDFAVRPSRPGLVVGYGAIPLDRIDDGLTRLLSVIDAEDA
ncbi:hypothetical protein [Streptosporangium roseum]|uniref:hypothetical protein n=1 Tax=Streptosporangium roseum TaxID=2001 RepID=UPI00157AC5C2